ncbi:MAG: hypothetical protein OXG81_13775 [Acidobacteria bacterium]|nr:hypothetical protein [Acidobacteriota bacterium]MCY3968431.1 hypothetical protein [Acidobacteriota bacterium]
MSKVTADILTRSEAMRIETLNPERTDLPAENIGSAVLGILSATAAIARVKERLADADQQELMQLVDEEVDAARAGRP